MNHNWVPSTLGHGEAMCSHCFVTNREAAVLGMAECEAPPPKPANDQTPAMPQFTQEQIDQQCLSEVDESDDELSDEEAAGQDCGRWDNGRLGRHCSKAGSEECDWQCPYSR